MKPKAYLLYHEQTNTTWANRKNWRECWKSEGALGYGTIEVDISNVFEMKVDMEKDGYVLVKNDPFRILNVVSEIIEEG